jgi:hypothetical protein
MALHRVGQCGWGLATYMLCELSKVCNRLVFSLCYYALCISHSSPGLWKAANSCLCALMCSCAAVGMEGFWGVLLSCAMLPVLGYVHGPDGLPLDSLAEAIQVRGRRAKQLLVLVGGGQ